MLLIQSSTMPPMSDPSGIGPNPSAGCATPTQRTTRQAKTASIASFDIKPFWSTSVEPACVGNHIRVRAPSQPQHTIQRIRQSPGTRAGRDTRDQPAHTREQDGYMEVMQYGIMQGL